MLSLIEKILICHKSFSESDIPYAFGGALALAWCVRSARGTIDIDLNLFVSNVRTKDVLDSLPEEIEFSKSDENKLKKDTQIRLWWDSTPIDLFLNSTPYHEEVLTRIRWEEFSGKTLPFLGCSDLAVFKVFYNRTKDWADLEAMIEMGTLDVEFVRDVIRNYLGEDDERLEKLEKLVYL